ncbi:MAG: TIGR02206 family membrane protein [Schleiferiaceae bacterium]|jgi:hypothetical integral membrane protein (TIGR02206 family)
MELHVALTPDSLLYWFGWALSLFIIVSPIWLGRNLSIQGRRAFERAWAILLMISLVIMTYMSVNRGEFTWGGSLPIHMCGISRLLIIGYFLLGKKWMGELVTFTGIAGGLQSLLTPEFTHGINPVYVFDYYMNHASIIAVGLYIIYVHQQPLQKWAWLRNFGRIQLMAVFAVAVNLLTGGNYMYLMEPPIVDNPLVIRSESFPYMHVVFFELFAALNFLLIEVVLRRIRVRNSIGVRVV